MKFRLPVIIITFIGFSASGSAQNDTTKKTELKPSGKAWGHVFGDYYYKSHADSLNGGGVQYSNTPKHMNPFDLPGTMLSAAVQRM